MVLGLPTGWMFGLDLQIWAIGERFSGISHIPNGIHYIYYSPPGELWRQGQFISIEKDFLVFRFDVGDERLILTDEAGRISDPLVPFTQVIQRQYDWEEFTNFISFRLLQSLTRDCKIEFSPIPSLVIPAGSTPSDITRFGMDKSQHLTQLIASRQIARDVDILGELQVAFLLFFLGQDYEALIHWRKLMELFLQCQEDGVRESVGLFGKFVQVLVAQVKEIPSEILTDVSSDGCIFLVPWIARFISECRESVNCRDLENVMAEKFDGIRDWAEWCADQEDEPVVVDNSY